MNSSSLRIAAASAIGALQREAVLVGLVTALLGVGGYLRMHAFQFPAQFLFDEHHFVENARSYLLGVKDWNDHPPLGKLIIAACMRVLGDNPVGWRAGALLSGLSTIALGGLAAARLFRDPRAGLIAAALLGSDGFLIAYSRVALLDGFLGTCAAAAALLASGAMTPLRLAAGIVLSGCALSIKFTGIAVLAPLAVAVLLLPASWARRLAWLSVLLLGSLASYVLWFVLGLSLAHQPSSVASVIDHTVELLKHHSSLTDMKHPRTSGWVTWLVPTKPILLGMFDEGSRVRALSSIGNRASWWAAVALGAATTARLLWIGLGRVVAAERSGVQGATGIDAFLLAHGRAFLILLSSVLGFLAPWVMTHRDSYIYHFLPSYVGLLLLLSGYLASCYRARSTPVLVWLGVVLAVLLYYAPIWSFMPIERSGVSWRLRFR